MDGETMKGSSCKIPTRLRSALGFYTAIRYIHAYLLSWDRIVYFLCIFPALGVPALPSVSCMFPCSECVIATLLLQYSLSTSHQSVAMATSLLIA
ncbi:hypothetical protein FKM82_025090 [Ascaphus truei]